MNQSYRTACYVDRVEGDHAVVTVGGVDLPPESVIVPVADLPQGVEAGKVFFARANLNATTPDEIRLSDIEPEWGQTGPLFFEADE